MLRLPAIVIAALLGAGLITVPASGSAAAPDLAAAIAWKPCTSRALAHYDLECGRLTVPRDHDDPAGPTLTLALTRRVHSEAPKGVILTNPGGPGASGLTLPALADYVPGGVGASYDWIGFDPRGVGASTPTLHCTRDHFGDDRPGYEPRTTAILRHWLRKSRRFSASCADTPAERALLPHLTTLDTVRDMEAIRVAVGAEKLGYYGFSYGSYLGQVYATRYPDRVGRFVLDGVVDPHRAWYASNLDQDRAFDRNLDSFWRYLAAHPAGFRLGRHWREIKRGYYRTLQRLDRRPAAGGRLGPSELTDAMVEAGYYVHDWVTLGHDYAALVRRGRGAAMHRRYRTAQGSSTGYAIYSAVQCSDVSWPGLARTLTDARSVHRRAPFLTWSNTWFNAPCLSWHAPRRTRLGVSGAAVTAKLLLISETRDAATPYAGALAVRSLFPSASLVAGIGGTTHSSSLSGVPCVDNAVATYLRSGAVPARLSGVRSDRACPRLAPPSPRDYFGRPAVGSGDRLSPRLRQDLVSAQRHLLG